jgi:hypothetical protein
MYQLTAAPALATMGSMNRIHPGVVCRYVDFRRTSSALCCPAPRI